MQVTPGIDVACRAAHQASLADESGRLAWSGRWFRATSADLKELWALILDGALVTVVAEPTRSSQRLRVGATWAGKTVIVHVEDTHFRPEPEAASSRS